MTPDVNILVAAFRKDHTHHASARQWLTMALSNGVVATPVQLFPPVVASCLRLVTNPKVFANPDGIAEALAFIDALLAFPGVGMGRAGEEWPQFHQLCLDGKLRGNAIPDAWLAASIVHTGGHLVTFDADFKKLLRRDQVTLLAAA